jgi:phosphatidylglycerophosphate synthase
VLTVRSGPLVGLTVQVGLLAALEVVVGLGGLAWGVGLACGVVLQGAVAVGLARSGAGVLAPGDLVTLTRATLACGVAALTADSLLHAPAVTALVTLAAVALVLDAVDGWVARHTRTESVFGAQFDGEADAFLILVLSVYVAAGFGVWVLAIGAARYVFALAGWGLPWLRRRLPPRYWRKVVAATQGVVLTVGAAEVVPRSLMAAALVVSLALLVESFGRDVWWSWRHRHAELAEPAGIVAGLPSLPASDGEVAADNGRSRRRRQAVVTGVTNVLALLLVWFALVAPNQAYDLAPGAFLRIPVEGLVLAGVALVVPALARRTIAAVIGTLLGLLAVVKIVDMGFFAALDRPFNLVTDRGYFEPAVGVLSDSIGSVGATVAVGTLVVVVIAVVVCMPLAVGRLTGLVARHHHWSVRAVTGLVVIWVVCSLSGLHIAQGEPIASADAGRLAFGKVREFTTDARDQARFNAAVEVDSYRTATGEELLGGLRGKDVLLAFVESYGRVALDGLPTSPEVRAVLDAGAGRLRASGYASRSAYLTSPTFGALSWLAHSTLQAGVWVDNQLRYDRLLTGDRMTLSVAFKRAGWRTVAVLPANDESWEEGESFYQYDRLYDSEDFGYRGPEFGWATMPDQFALSAFQRLELADRDRLPVMAEVDLTSSHAPWAPLPRMVDWDELGDGSVYQPIHDRGKSSEEVWRDPEDVKAEYVKSVAYSVDTLISFVEEYGDDDLVLVLLGDHQPATVVSGQDASRDVPITVIAHDPAVLDQISGWGWQDGMRPDPLAPVWPMDAFRDRFLEAYSPELPPTSTDSALPPQP